MCVADLRPATSQGFPLLLFSAPVYALDMLPFALYLPQAELKLASMFTDHMVLQRQANCNVWGWAKPGETILVSGSWGATAHVKADATGKWRTQIKTGAAGGPYTLKVNNIELKDVLIGEVWLCSGQSNMEMFVDNYRSPAPVVDWQKELQTSANYPNIRVFQVTKKMSATPEPLCGGAWQVSSPTSVGPFSAVGFFFGRKLADELKIPIGVIHPSWGGTEVELWTSEQGMRALPELGEKLDTYRKNVQENVVRQAAFQEEMKKFVPTEKPEWSAPGFDDSSWKTIAKPTSFETMGLGDFDGAVWFRATVEIPADLAGQTGRLKLGAIDDEDRTYFNGVLVGQNNEWDAQRNYEVKNLSAGKAVVAVRAFDGAGQGGFNGDQFLEVVGRKLALTNWHYFVVRNPNQPPRPNLLPARNFSTLFNGMINPCVPFTMRGALWYQGESNVSTAEQYRRSFPNMIEDWRRVWGIGDFPFYYVQIAPFAYWPPYGPELREAQSMTLSLKNTGMAVTTDLVDDLQNIHPVKKREVGERLALIALARDYGQKIEYSGPTLKSVKIEGRSVRLAFNHGVGLNGNLDGFFLAGADGVYCAADARIEGDTVVLSSIQIDAPKTVRYGWSDTAFAGLWNGAGLPASPFRTDKLPLMTQGARW